MKIGIAGFGVVGQAVYGACCRGLNGVVIHDPPKGKDNFNQLLDCGAIFVCLPTPMLPNGKQDFSKVNGLLDDLQVMVYSGLIIIKSTCLWENLKPWCSSNKLRIVVNPEFLNANSAARDFAEQQHIILGGDMDTVVEAQGIYEDEFNLDEVEAVHVVTAKQACEIKLMHNVYHAYRILFWNFCQEVTGNERLIADKICAVIGSTPAREKAQICADGRPGYGGACFPKDVNACGFQTKHPLLKFMRSYNIKLRGEPEE